MAQPYIFKPPDLIGDYATLEKLRQGSQEFDLRKQQLEQQGAAQKSLQDYRNSVIDERDINASQKSAAAGDYNMANQIFNGNENLVKKFGKATFAPGGVSTTTMSKIEAGIVGSLATDPATGKIDPEKAIEVMHRMKANPQGANSRVFDILSRRNSGQPTTPEELQTIEDYKGFLTGAAGARTAGALNTATDIKGTGRYQATEANVAMARRAGGEQGQLSVQKTPEYQKAQAGIAGARVEGTAAAKDSLPGSGSNLMNPRTMEFADANMSADEARQNGFSQKVSDKQKKSLSELEGVDTSFGELSIAAKQLQGRSGALMASHIIPGSQTVSEDARIGAAYESTKARFSQMFDRLIGGVRAAASLPYVKFTGTKVLPNFFDDDKTIDFKMQALGIVLNALKDEKRREVTGQPPDPNIGKQLQALGDQLDKLGGGRGAGAPATRGATQPGGPANPPPPSGWR